MFKHKHTKYLARIFSLTLASVTLLSIPMFAQGQRQEGQGQRQGSGQGQGAGQQQRQQGQGQQQGQNNRVRQGMLRGFDTLPVILRIVQDFPPASLVVLDLKEVGWESYSSNILRQDPLVVLNLNLVGLDASSGAGLELIEREGWVADVPRWCLMAADGKVLYSTEQTPNPELIMDAFRSSGLKSRLDILRNFLAIYPDHAEARLALLDELRAVAEAKTRAELGISGLGSGSNFLSGQNVQTNIPEPPQLLDSGIDGDIWGEYARELESAFQNGLWKQENYQFAGNAARNIAMVMTRGGNINTRGLSVSMVSVLGQHSPMMKRLYQRWLPEIEYALVTRPSSEHLWRLWQFAQRAAGGRDLKALQASLIPVPDFSPQEIPSPYIRTQWLQDCIDRGDLRMAEDVAREVWEKLLMQASPVSTTRQGLSRGAGRPRNQGTDSTMLDARAWNDVEQYIDILLRQDKTSAADSIVQQWIDMGGWTGAAQRARNLANRLGLTDLGSRWGSLAPDSAPPGRR